MAVTQALYAAVCVALAMVVGCAIGYQRGRVDARKAERAEWKRLINTLYRNCKGGDEFKIELVTKAQHIAKKGWRA
jgi:xanthine/uracil permease